MIARIPESPGLRDLGVTNWLVCKVIAARQRVPRAHLFTTLGQHRRLMWSWLPFGGMLMRGGKFSARDTELVILRVGHLRDSQYELQHHRRMARAVGLDEATQERIFQGPDAPGLADRQRALLTGVDELIETRSLSDATWALLATHLDRPRLIEFVMLTSQYDALAATLSALRVPLDFDE
ncbi:carboxymuconolactone decarboxylase family protein [Mycolicibacter hiberniae]|uniref:4-carboxymuconolactone decarboxylase n=1 Tax=Mycolicibacter hiberniae TaxID=29314 RepID=A0A7I7X7M8_9MYCO|nr:carboxymuconolactone decarboxylase family protein [Mycolicibacter hiberniae]MCV7087232.1 carboxymuconolactone decarboxylase family protein [Mycolicibacter hiberniae]ORV67782.1 4-carboxymuconolactone decarboxylase [Mycolicibacter hiberniae]BBZ25554.1 4-carboxymuconolactone decarboxylase [Mycolicibacter hiberniae]